jgi:hypothetical protein
MHCGLVNLASATQCKRCGTLFAQNVATSGANIQGGFVTEDGYVLPPPPSTLSPNSGVWRSGSNLVLSFDAVLPLRCVKCNAFTTGRLTRKYSWHHPALYLILLVALLVYLIVAAILRKRATIEVGLCEDHQAKRKYAILTTVLLVLLGLGGFALAIAIEDGTPAFIGFLLLVTSLIFGLFATRVGYPTKIDERFVWLKGFSKDYLETFPSWPGF